MGRRGGGRGGGRGSGQGPFLRFGSSVSTRANPGVRTNSSSQGLSPVIASNQAGSGAKEVDFDKNEGFEMQFPPPGATPSPTIGTSGVINKIAKLETQNNNGDEGLCSPSTAPIQNINGNEGLDFPITVPIKSSNDGGCGTAIFDPIAKKTTVLNPGEPALEQQIGADSRKGWTRLFENNQSAISELCLERMVVGLGTWEEEIYWKRFNSMHFFQILPNDFYHHLVLPLKFAENMMTELPGKVSLIGPSGIMWDVAVTKTNKITLVGDGWKEFVKAHDLEVNSILMFKYKRNFGFEVLIFDQVSLCEKEAAYFVKKCEHTKSNHHENDKKRSSVEAFSTEVVEDEDKDDNDSEFVALKKARKDGDERLVRVVERENPQTPQKCSSDGVTQGGKGRGTPTEAVPLKSASELQDKFGGEKLKENEVAEKQHVPETGGSTLEMGHSHESSETKGKKPNGNEATEERNSTEIWGSTLETIRSHKSSKTKGRPRKRVAPRSLRERILESGNKPNGNEVTKEVNSPEIGGSTHETVLSHESIATKGKPKKRVASKSPRKLVFGSDTSKKYSKVYISNRRPVTETEKENAIQRAREKQNERSFTAVMRPSGVYKRFFLNVPTEWIHKHLPHRHQEVVLRVGEKTWLSMFYYYNSQKGGGISGTGWKKFALDNFLEEFDVCQFKLASQKDDPAVVFDVGIFRVIPEIVLPSPNIPVVPSTIA